MEFPFLIIIGIVIYFGVQASKKAAKASVVPKTSKRQAEDPAVPELPEELYPEQYEYKEVEESDKSILQTGKKEIATKYTPMDGGQEKSVRKEKESSASDRKLKIQSKEEARRAVIYSEIIRRKY